MLKIHYYKKNGEFSYNFFPHIFKAIGPLEKNLETKNDFLRLWKTVFFRWCRIINRKMRKNGQFLVVFYSFFEHRFYIEKNMVFKRHIFTIYILNQIWLVFVKMKFVCTMVILQVFNITCFAHTMGHRKYHVFDLHFHQKSSFSCEK